jgi:cytochrome c553
MKKTDPQSRPVKAPVDETFDPWEQVRPVPLFVLAVVFALAFWGLLTYISEYQAQRRALEKKAETNLLAPVRPAPPAIAGSLSNTPGVADGDAATLQMVALGKGQAWSCASCHGEAGQGNLNTPRLAGQPAEYLHKQLQDFKTGLRHNESMQFVARALSGEDMAKLASYYAGIKLSTAVAPTLGGDLARGRVIAEKGDWKTDVPACFSCHGMGGEGVAPGFPALAGQKPDYIFGQLAAWHKGERKNSPQALMDGIARRMSFEDMRAVADYLASMPSRAQPSPVQAAATPSTPQL